MKKKKEVKVPKRRQLLSMAIELAAEILNKELEESE